MNDRVVGVFADLGAAEKARANLSASGVEPTRTTVKRVLQPGHRGFADSDAVHSLIHSPEIRETDTVREDAGTVILIVEMVPRPDVSDPQTRGEPADSDETDSGGSDAYDTEVILRTLEHLGATDTHVVEATPPLDL